MNSTHFAKHKTPNKYVYLGTVTLIILVLVVLADYPVVGQLLIGVYAAMAFWRLESGHVFRLAMVALGVVVASTVLGWVQVVNAFSGYSFLLFMVGVFVLTRELWRYSQELRRQKEDKAR